MWYSADNEARACLKGFCFNIVSDDIVFKVALELEPGSVVLIRTTSMIVRGNVDLK